MTFETPMRDRVKDTATTTRRDRGGHPKDGVGRSGARERHSAVVQPTNEDRHTVRHQLAYSLVDQKLVARLDDGGWDLRNPLTAHAAVEHLRTQGVPAAVAEALIADRQYPVVHGYDCVPGKPEFFRRQGRTILNTYQSPALPEGSGKPEMFTDIIDILFSVGGNREAVDWLVNWMAAKIQRPGEPSRTAVVLTGSPGTGKTTLGRVFAEILGPKNCVMLAPADLRSHFNATFAGKLLVVANEVTGAQVSRDFESRLKPYVTEPVVQVHDKYHRAHSRPNRATWFLTSNSELPIRLDADDRRFTIIENRQPPSQVAAAAMRRLHGSRGGWSQRGLQGLANFAQFLRRRRVDLRVAWTPLATEARDRIIETSQRLAAGSQLDRETP